MCCLNRVNHNHHQKLESFEVHHFRFRKSQFRRAQSKETTLPFCTRKLEGHPMGLNDAIIWSSETSPVSCRSSDDAWSRTPAIDVTCLWCEEDAASLKSKTACCKTVDEGQQGSVSVDGQQNEALCDENARQLPIKEDDCLANNTGIKACTVFLNPAIFSPNPRRLTKRMCCSKSSLSPTRLRLLYTIRKKLRCRGDLRVRVLGVCRRTQNWECIHASSSIHHSPPSCYSKNACLKLQVFHQISSLLLSLVSSLLLLPLASHIPIA